MKNDLFANRYTVPSLRLSSIGLLLAIAACGTSEESVNTDYSNLSLAPISGKSLSPTSNVDFTSYVKNGIRLRVLGNSNVVLAADTAAGGSNAVEQSQFSTTNVHEFGVDEDDRIKFDGSYIYLSEDNYFPTSAQSGKPAIRILQTDTMNAHADEVARIERDDELKVEGLYLHQNDQNKSLISIARSYQYYASILEDQDWHWASGKTEIQVRNVVDPVNPTLDWKIEIEGNLEGSRKIGDRLYLLTRYVPEIEGINYYPANDEEKIATEKLILDTPVADLLPHYQTNDGAIKSLVRPDQCLIAQDYKSTHGYADIITLTAINLTSLEVESAACLNANVQGIYSSSNNFYIGASGIVGWMGGGHGTTIHKFALTDAGVEYKASGFVRGELGWQDPSFRMSEKQGMIRVVTTEWQSGEPENFLTILSEGTSSQLVQTSQLPNETNPEPIGKPQEEIYAVRFVGDKAYIITFERVDPLYQIDLSDPASPVIASALEMPGVARYLHPVAENWLLGIGHEVVDGLMQEVKVELYDIRDPQAPKVVDTQLFGERGSWSDVFNSLKAVSLLQNEQGNLQIALPITRYGYSGTGGSQWQDTGLYLFEISEAEQQALSLSHVGTLVTEETNNSQYPVHWGRGRSILHSDSIYYLQGNRLIGAKQEELDNTTGPF